jgi:hypothetical protein
MASIRQLGSKVFSGLSSVVVIAVVTFLLLEVAIRVFIPQQLPSNSAAVLHQPDASLGWSRIPNARLQTNMGERSVLICTDEIGDRIDCDAPPARTCERNILVLGDSFVEALSVPFAETVWGRIEASRGEVCTQVAGVGAYYPGQYVTQAQIRLQSDNPDLVLLNLYLGNDIVDNIDWKPPADMVAMPQFQILPSGFSKADIINWALPLHRRIRAYSHAYVGVLNIAKKLVDPDGFVRYGIPPAISKSGMTAAHVAKTVAAVKKIAELAQEKDIPLVVTLIPIRNQVLDPDGRQMLEQYPNLAKDLDMLLVQKRILPKLEAIEGVNRLVDLLPGLIKIADPQYWGTRDPHLSPTGHAGWFEILNPVLSEFVSE